MSIAELMPGVFFTADQLERVCYLLGKQGISWSDIYVASRFLTMIIRNVLTDSKMGTEEEMSKIDVWADQLIERWKKERKTQ